MLEGCGCRFWEFVLDVLIAIGGRFFLIQLQLDAEGI